MTRLGAVKSALTRPRGPGLKVDDRASNRRDQLLRRQVVPQEYARLRSAKAGFDQLGVGGQFAHEDQRDGALELPNQPFGGIRGPAVTNPGIGQDQIHGSSARKLYQLCQ